MQEMGRRRERGGEGEKGRQQVVGTSELKFNNESDPCKLISTANVSGAIVQFLRSYQWVTLSPRGGGGGGAAVTVSGPKSVTRISVTRILARYVLQIGPE